MLSKFYISPTSNLLLKHLFLMIFKKVEEECKIIAQLKKQKPTTMSFPDFSRRFSVSLAKSIDTFGEVLLKDFTQT